MTLFAESLAVLSGLNIWYFSGDGSIGHFPGNDDLSGISNELDIISLKDLSHIDKDPVLLYRDIHSLSFLHGILLEGVLVCGPFIDSSYPPADDGFLDMAMQLQIPAIGKREIIAIGKLIRQFTQADEADILKKIPKAGATATHNPAQDDLNRMNRQVIDASYDMEREIRNHVENGDKEGMKKFLESFFPTETMIRRLPHNPLRQAKNGGVILNTILRISAERGGLIPIHLHGMSSEFAGRIERSKTIEEMDRLRTEMCLAYCDAVYKFSLKNHSLAVRKTSEYIITHLDEKLSLNILAEKLSCSAPYLARQFKKEYAMTVGDYIRRQKVEEAKYLLSNTTESLLDISIKIGYEDMGYFARVFKKTTGKSPSAYRNHMIDGIDNTV